MNAIFSPRHAALVDLQALQVVADGAPALFSTVLGTISQHEGLILSGLCPSGQEAVTRVGEPWASLPPGSLPASGTVQLSAGKVVLPDAQGRMYLLTLPEAQSFSLGGAADAVALGLKLARTPAASGTSVAGYDQLTPTFFLLRADAVPDPQTVVLAVGHAGHWLTDVQRLWDTDHPGSIELASKLEQLEQLIWSRTESEEARGLRSAVGRQWNRQQMMATAAIQLLKMRLESQTFTTQARIGALAALIRRLAGLAPFAARQLATLAGPNLPANPYRRLLS